MKRSNKVTTAGSAMLSLLACIILAGCDRNPAPTSVEGAWLGTGKFHTAAGSTDVQAQLEILSGGSYRFLILKPQLLALTGAETGIWSVNAQTLVLTRAVEPAQPSTATNPGSVFQQLRKGSGATPPRSLTVSGDLRELQFNDGKMELIFARNNAATSKLRTSGEIRDK